MSTMASQIASLAIVYPNVYSDADQRKYQSSASLAFVREINRWPVNSPHKGPETQKMFPFDDVTVVLQPWHDERHWRMQYSEVSSWWSTYAILSYGESCCACVHLSDMNVRVYGSIFGLFIYNNISNHLSPNVTKLRIFYAVFTSHECDAFAPLIASNLIYW